MFTFEGRPVDFSLVRDIDPLRGDWLALEADHAPSAYQRFTFVREWSDHVARTVGLEPRILVGRSAGRTVVIAPLALKRRPLPLLMPLSDSHTNLNGGLFADGVVGGDLAGTALRLEAEAEGFEACCMREDDAKLYGDQPIRSVHDAFVARVDEGFDAFLARNSGKRKRKKHRRSVRHFDELGGWHVERIRTRTDLRVVLDEAWSWMAARFKRDGIDDPFAPPEVRAFFLEACASCLDDDRPALGLWRLVVGGRTAAIMAAGFGGRGYAPMFTSYRTGGVEGDSPGEFLIYELCKMAADMDCEEFDLGRGREPYKLSWTDGPVTLYDLRIARTARASVYLGTRTWLSRAKRGVRDDERLWAIAKHVRAAVGRR